MFEHENKIIHTETQREPERESKMMMVRLGLGRRHSTQSKKEKKRNHIKKCDQFDRAHTQTQNRTQNRL